MLKKQKGDKKEQHIRVIKNKFCIFLYASRTESLNNHSKESSSCLFLDVIYYEKMVVHDKSLE